MYPPMPSPSSRKRPAPDTTPAVPVSQMQQPSYTAAAQADQSLLWNNGAVGNNLADATASRSVNPYGVMTTQGQYGQGLPPSSSTALARRGMSQALVPAAPRQPFDANSASWGNFEDESLLRSPSATMDENDNIELLEERAARAKRDAQAKRKQIPPFVQKLRSFLDESKNTELIRWSENGDSFIVLDEDEFARTLIPELFKHNNYASFVRQLNMYGFHKRVGLSDNSMKASERKNKSPSEYYNPFFKRGHPNLLWLINKPKSGAGKKKGNKKEDVDGDSEDDGLIDEPIPPQAYAKPPPLGNRSPTASEVGPLQKKDLVQVKTQLDKLQQQQLAISQLIERLRRDHNQLVNQAIMFQNMHERHENSINAILNFLANVFRKSLEEQGGAQSVSDLLTSILPGQQQMPQGSIVDLGEFIHQQNASPATSVNNPKRQPRLLPPIPNMPKTKKGGGPTPAPAPPAPAPQQAAPYQSAPPVGSVTELFDTPPSEMASPSHLQNELRTNPRQGMMKIIQDTNAGGSSGLDLPDVAANTPVTMSHEQRDKMLNIMAGQGLTGSGSVPATAGSPPNPAAPPPNLSTSASPNMSLSTAFPSISPPSLQEIRSRQSEIEALQQLQSDQSSKLDELSALLGPLSPSGRVPGVDEAGNPIGLFDHVDYDQFLDPVALNDLNNYNIDFNGTGIATNTDGNDFNFSLDPSSAGDANLGQPVGQQSVFRGDDAGTGRVVDPGSNNNTPSPTDTEEILRNDPANAEHDAKRRRRF